MRIAVAMSGGVDSSVAALLLRREGAVVAALEIRKTDEILAARATKPGK